MINSTTACTPPAGNSGGQSIRNTHSTGRLLSRAFLEARELWTIADLALSAVSIGAQRSENVA